MHGMGYQIVSGQVAVSSLALGTNDVKTSFKLLHFLLELAIENKDDYAVTSVSSSPILEFPTGQFFCNQDTIPIPTKIKKTNQNSILRDY